MLFCLFIASLEITGNQVSTLGNGNIVNNALEVVFCTFFGLTGSNGGGISISGIVSCFLTVYDTTFYLCTATNGGSIYYYCSKSEISIKRSCFSNCSASNGGSIYSILSNDVSSKHFYEKLTVSWCNPKPTNHIYGFHADYGFSQLVYSNSSKNTGTHSYLAMFYVSSFNHKFNQIAGTSIDIVCGFVGCTFSTSISLTNYIQNTVFGSNRGIFHNNGCLPYINISDCIFVKNTINAFELYNGGIYCYHSFFDSLPSNGQLFGCISTSDPNTLSIAFLDTYLCKNEVQITNMIYRKTKYILLLMFWIYE